MIGLDGIARARQIGKKGTFGEDMRNSTLWVEKAQRPVGNFLGAGRLDGITRYYSYRTLNEYPLIVMVGTSEVETLAEFRGAPAQLLCTAGVVTFFTVLFRLDCWQRYRDNGAPRKR